MRESKRESKRESQRERERERSVARTRESEKSVMIVGSDLSVKRIGWSKRRETRRRT